MTDDPVTAAPTDEVPETGRPNRAGRNLPAAIAVGAAVGAVATSGRQASGNSRARMMLSTSHMRSTRLATQNGR